jgi:Mrp family chromosome partitioning ATPase
MTADWIDRAFLARRAMAVRDVPDAAAATEACRPAGPVAAAAAHVALEQPPTDPVARLLALAPEAWGRLAAPVVAAVAHGKRVVAVTGGAAGAGRSTVVAGLAVTLRARGMTVAITTAAPLRLEPDAARASRAADVVLVDAGPWFGEAILRRGAVARAALGCDAVVVVARDDSPAPAAWSRLLARLGLEVLAEVRTFAGAAA